MSSRTQTLLLTSAAMIAFAGNSLLCRMALKHTAIDPTSFTSIRIASGAGILWMLMRLQDRNSIEGGNWPSAVALVCYAICFAWAYKGLSAGTGALLLFGTVQTTMIGYGMHAGERLSKRQVAGLGSAIGGLVLLLLPGISAPPLLHFLLMMGAGVAWGVYSLLGKGVTNPSSATAGNFLRATPCVMVLSMLTLPWADLDVTGVSYAVLSGALASGLGYVIWYAALRGLEATSAGTVQLSVPVIAAIGGIFFLSEPLTFRLLISSALVLGGIAVVIRKS